MIEFKTKYSRALLSNVQYLEIDEGVNLVLKRMVIIRRVYFEVKMNDIEILIPWGSLSMRPYLSINDLIYELFNNFLGQWNIYELAFRPDVHSSFYRTFPEL